MTSVTRYRLRYDGQLRLGFAGVGTGKLFVDGNLVLESTLAEATDHGRRGPRLARRKRVAVLLAAEPGQQNRRHPVARGHLHAAAPRPSGGAAAANPRTVVNAGAPTLEVPWRAFAHWADGRWAVEPGEHEVRAGSPRSSATDALIVQLEGR